MLVAVVALAMAVGIAGTILPVVPGLALVAGAALVYGLVEGFGTAGVVAMVVIIGVGIVGTGAGLVIPQRSAAASGAPRSSVLVGAIGALLGFWLIPVVGLPIGGVLGIYVGERWRTGDAATAWVTTKATVRGFGLASLAQLAAGLIMAMVWVVWVLA